MTYRKEKQAAIAAVAAAGQFCRQIRDGYQNDFLFKKKDSSPVTIADFGSQVLVTRMILQEFPSDSFVGEESSDELRSPKNRTVLDQLSTHLRRYSELTTKEILGVLDMSRVKKEGRFWVLDPLDGTKGFLRNAQYCVALALIEDGKAKVAAISAPNLLRDPEFQKGPRGLLFVAVEGEGVEVFDSFTLQKMEGFHNRRISNRLIESLEPSSSDQGLQETIALRLGLKKPPMKMDSQVKYCILSQGLASLYIRIKSSTAPSRYENIWDHAAGSLILEESGGVVTDSRGHRLDFSSGKKMKGLGIIASRGIDHNIVLGAVKVVVSDSPK